MRAGYSLKCDGVDVGRGIGLEEEREREGVIPAGGGERC